MASKYLVASAKEPTDRVLRAPALKVQTHLDPETGLEDVVTESQVRLHAARLLAAGFKPSKVSAAMARYLSPSHNVHAAHVKLRRWMRTDPTFRDMIYNEAVVKLDLSSPEILDGLRKSARRGRVDAARFALELTGRHTKDETPVTTVNVVLTNIPRPEGGNG
jgi:hypothetical protein